MGNKGRRYVGGAKGGVKTYEQSLYVITAPYKLLGEWIQKDRDFDTIAGNPYFTIPLHLTLI